MTEKEEEEYTARLVEKLAATAIDLNTIAVQLNSLATCLTIAHPAIPGE